MAAAFQEAGVPIRAINADKWPTNVKANREYADFDAAINAMIATGCDPLQIQRMKKKKLMLKDRMYSMVQQYRKEMEAD